MAGGQIGKAGHQVVERSLSVGGEVKKPGRVKYQRGITIFQAITQSGGPTVFAKMSNVTLQRNGKKYQYDLTKPAHKKVKVYPDDVIVVTGK